jgi:hypothetical protein
MSVTVGAGLIREITSVTVSNGLLIVAFLNLMWNVNQIRVNPVVITFLSSVRGSIYNTSPNHFFHVLCF